MLKRKLGLTLFFFFTLCVSSALAIPVLQIYIHDSVYDDESESWLIDNPEFRLDVVGANELIADVKVAFAVPVNEDGTITVSKVDSGGAVITGSEFFLEETTTPETIYTQAELDDTDNLYFAMEDANFGEYYFVDYGTPKMGDGKKDVPGGGMFPSSYYQFYLGDFGLGDNVPNYEPPIDFSATKPGHIEQLFITISGYTSVSIIAYDHIVYTDGTTGKYKVNPYSHDGSFAVPEPSTFLLLGLGLLGLGAFGYRRGKEK